MISVASAATSISTALAIVGAALLLLLSPAFVHVALDRAGSAPYLGVSASEAHALSDRTISELLLGPGTFDFPRGEAGARFYDDAEASHLRDVRLVLQGFLVTVSVALVVLAGGLIRARHAAWLWRAVARGGLAVAAAFTVVGAFFVLAFDAAFTLFHEVVFPGGNWSFDPATERLVQLYPMTFWELTSTVLGALAIAGGLLAWWLARARVAALSRGADG